MRRVQVLLVVMVLALGWAAPARAEGSGGASCSWSWGAFAEGFVGWAESVWRVVASSEGELPEGDEPDVVALDPDETVNAGPAETDGEKFPGLDPWG